MVGAPRRLSSELLVASDQERFFPPEIAHAVGRITLGASTLEVRIVQAIGIMLQADDTGTRIMTVDSQFRWLLERCRSLSRARLSGSTCIDVLAWLELAERANNERNRVIHAHWYRSVWKDTIGRGGYGAIKLGGASARSTKHGLVESRAPTSAEELDRIADELERVATQGEDLLSRIRAAFG